MKLNIENTVTILFFKSSVEDNLPSFIDVKDLFVVAKITTSNILKNLID
ncbi:hypothetical protein NIES37_48490 [Tolypothrix tenuis PCC 7101]|uniref:Uncharacterized protein n=1 Tax=Tolypothrix tenuis PCC 7101 TaxID=231146 RepID=A0A1Z4N584_9CYAN|nr:hypothetical protein NIES37_48490 [Tolypothrix tenuis PCC 7101]BAZ75226.1 hypothetical protein NIES50_38060 [Aulosira laxa NIES-50]